MTTPQIQRATKTKVEVQHTASTQSTGEIRIPISELWVWQHVDSLAIMRQAGKEAEAGELEDLSAYLTLHKDD